MAKLNDFTVCLAVDDGYIRHLAAAVPTWRLHRGALMHRPWVVFIDRDAHGVEDRVADLLDGTDLRIYPWPMTAKDHCSQAEKMLSAFVHGPPDFVETPLWMKLDVDVIATGSPQVEGKDWEPHQWMSHNSVYLAPGWSYTRPADQMSKLDDWGDSIPELGCRPRLNLPFDQNAKRCHHKRMCSWVSFYRTDFTAEVASFCDRERLPVPSQDGTVWYVAERLGLKWSRYGAKFLGWKTISAAHRLEAEAAKVIALAQ